MQPFDFLERGLGQERVVACEETLQGVDLAYRITRGDLCQAADRPEDDFRSLGGEGHPAVAFVEQGEQILVLQAGLLASDLPAIGNQEQDLLLTVGENNQILTRTAGEVEIAEGDSQGRQSGGALQGLLHFDDGVLQAAAANPHEGHQIRPGNHLEQVELLRLGTQLGGSAPETQQKNRQAHDRPLFQASSSGNPLQGFSPWPSVFRRWRRSA